MTNKESAIRARDKRMTQFYGELRRLGHRDRPCPIVTTSSMDGFALGTVVDKSPECPGLQVAISSDDLWSEHSDPRDMKRMHIWTRPALLHLRDAINQALELYDGKPAKVEQEDPAVC